LTERGTPMVRIAAFFVAIGVLFGACSPESVEYEEYTKLGSMDYSKTLNIYCLLDPESRVQDLTVERMAAPYGPPVLHFGQELGIKLIHGDETRLFQRVSQLPMPNDAWDHYVLPDSVMDIQYTEVYRLEVETSWGAACRGSTLVPGPFEIISPRSGGTVDIQARLTVRWSESPSAYGYVVYVYSQLKGSSKRYSNATRETSLTLPYGLKDTFIKPYFESFEAGNYVVEVWAVDKNYFDFYMADPDDPYSKATSGLEGAAGIFGSRVIRHVTFLVK